MRRVVCWVVLTVETTSAIMLFRISNHTGYQAPKGAEPPVFQALETKARV